MYLFGNMRYHTLKMNYLVNAGLLVSGTGIFKSDHPKYESNIYHILNDFTTWR